MRTFGYAIVLCVVIPAVAAMTAEAIDPNSPCPTSAPTPTPQAAPLFRTYREVAIGMTGDQAREKLGTPKEKSSAGDYFVFSTTESAQLLYDKDRKVKAITVNFSGDLKTAPTPREVVGGDVKKEPDGSISKMVSFPKDGYWVSYIRTAGKDAMIIITLQKLTVE
jgi:hypothetical protein